MWNRCCVMHSTTLSTLLLYFIEVLKWILCLIKAYGKERKKLKEIFWLFDFAFFLNSSFSVDRTLNFLKFSASTNLFFGKRTLSPWFKWDSIALISVLSLSIWDSTRAFSRCNSEISASNVIKSSPLLLGAFNIISICPMNGKNGVRTRMSKQKIQCKFFYCFETILGTKTFFHCFSISIFLL